MNIIQKIQSLFKSSPNTPANIDGQWAGYYGYGDQYPEVTRKKVVKFMAQINVDGDEFEGFIKEDETNGIPEIAKIDGILRGRKIAFVKTYSRTYGVDQNGVRTVISEHPQYISYSGVHNESQNKFVGQWKIETMYKSSDGSTRTQISIGHWEMTKLGNIE